MTFYTYKEKVMNDEPEYYITTQARLFIDGICKEQGEEAAEKLGGEMLSIIEHYKKEIKKITKKSNKESDILAIYKHVDEIIAKNLEKHREPPISCKPGCAECCRMFVGITKSELIPIMRWVTFTNYPLDMGRLVVQRGKGDQGFYTNKMGNNNKCVFLDPGNACVIYPLRPMACRLHYVVSPPGVCNMEFNNECLKIFDLEAECIAMALLNIEGEGRQMADMILEYLEERRP